jgi:hypothetical protein
MRARHLLCVAAAAAPVVSIALASPALGAPGGAGAAAGAGVPAARASSESAAKIPTANSPTFAGYSLRAAGEANWASTSTFRVPRVSCGKARSGIAPSSGVYLGTSSSAFAAASLFVGCYQGKAHYWPSLHLGSKNFNFPAAKAHPGDTIVVRASIVLHGSARKSETVSVSVVDKTRKITKKKSEKLTGPSLGGGYPWTGDSAWEVRGKFLRVPRFGKLRFSHALVNGGAWRGPSIVRYNRVSKTGQLQIKTGALSRSHEAFSTFFRHS